MFYILLTYHMSEDFTISPVLYLTDGSNNVGSNNNRTSFHECHLAYGKMGGMFHMLLTYHIKDDAMIYPVYL